MKNSKKREIMILNSHFILFIKEFYNPKLDDENYLKTLVDNYLFNYLGYINSISVEDGDFELLESISKDGESYIEKAIELLTEKLRFLQTIERKKYNIPTRTEEPIEEIFSGLEYSGNNDTRSRNIPSAFALATF